LLSSNAHVVQMFMHIRQYAKVPTTQRSIFICTFCIIVVYQLHVVDADYSTKLNPKTTWGVWEGWGTSVAWWGKAFGNRDDLADVIFTSKYVNISNENLPGLKLNIARYNVGGCSWNVFSSASMVASPHIPRSKQMEGYWLDWQSEDPSSSSWNWTVDANQRDLVKKAQARGANLFELFSNSPMWWMCDNHNPSGAANGDDDNLQTWNYKQHAYYLATVAKHFRDSWDLTFDSVEAFNEPLGNWWKADGTQEGCHMTQSTQAQIIPLLRQALNSYGLTSMKVSASDENTYDEATSTWKSFSSAVKGDVGRVNTHGYQYSGGRRDALYDAVDGKKLWNSEYGEGDASGASLVSNLNLDLRWLHPTAWVYWQVLDGGGWGLIVSDIDTRTVGKANQKYFVLAQYTRHIKPGMVIIDGGEGNTIAAYDESSKVLVIVTMNYNTAQQITFDLSAFAAVKGPIVRWETSINGDVKYSQHTDVTLKGTSFSLHFNANTIQTFEVSGVM
jgi:galactan endo-1,6-beta-galactosidase